MMHHCSRDMIRLCLLPTRMLTIILHYHHRTGGNSCAADALNAAVSHGLDFCENRANPISIMKGNNMRPSSANFSSTESGSDAHR